MRSMVEGHSDSVSPSTALRAVPLPIACGDREDKAAPVWHAPCNDVPATKGAS
jgi:hypothetical protein